jgi:hypothetical protein
MICRRPTKVTASSKITAPSQEPSKAFLNNPLGCNSCLQQGLITWDRDINESLVWDAMRKMITEKKAAEQQAAEEEVTS